MSTSHENHPNRKEEHADLQAALWREVRASESTMYTNPALYVPVHSPDWGFHTDKARAFQRARTIFQAVTHHSTYWELDYGLSVRPDSKALPEETRRARTARLLQLVALSRVRVEPVSADWNMPSRQDVSEVVEEMREETGVAEEYLRRRQDPNIKKFSVPDFPGLNDELLAEAILDDQLRVGNPEQPQVVCWRPLENT